MRKRKKSVTTVVKEVLIDDEIQEYLLMKIPYERLNPDTLRALTEEFVTRDGTDYGEEEATLEDKIGQVTEQLKTGKAVLTYDEKTRTCNIINKENGISP